jgi:predicted small integral membrane protein
VLVSLCKTSLVAMVAAFFALVAFNNVVDYGSNWTFIQHVLAMDTVFPGSTLKLRAISDPGLAMLAYWAIIGWEIATAIILGVASIRLTARCRSPRHFSDAKPLAVLGLTMGLLLYGFGITIVGGEWFAMWQSKVWNGLDSAARFILLDGIVLAILLTPELPPKSP